MHEHVIKISPYQIHFDALTALNDDIEFRDCIGPVMAKLFLS